ncbi:Xaa-Pro dipeptidase [Lachnospiraceae bacterium KHCPX20]|nr:Xaa-Pro dipeptidase [Lachnospiraceae bacterium KHCPX20]
MTRLQRVMNELEKHGLKQMIICDPDSIWYLTGIDVAPYERLFALLLQKDKQPVLFVNQLFFLPEHVAYPLVWHTDSDDPVAQIAEYVDPTQPLGIDKEWPARFLIPLMEKLPSLTVKLSSDCVDDCRAVKDEEEKEKMRIASQINDKVILMAKDYIKAGMTEKEVAAYIDQQYLLNGCEGPSFTTIVSFGANAADPHHEPDDTVLKEGDCVLLDMGCRKDRYCSDMTRTFFFGEPAEEYAKIHDLVRQANEKAEAMIRPGIPICELDRAARDLITEAGYGEYFNHRLGHFIGQRDHEKGDVSETNTTLTKPGMIFSIEPGVYLPGKFGVRIEDLVLVTEDGCEVLNKVDKRYAIIG